MRGLSSILAGDFNELIVTYNQSHDYELPVCTETIRPSKGWTVQMEEPWYVNPDVSGLSSGPGIP